jgi:Ca2+-binding EF-hand superfamily protein
VDYATFCKQVEQLVGERSLLLQLAFDVFDSNNDGKLSELDLFKALFNYEKSTKDKSSFVEVLLDDFNRITKIFKSNWSTKLAKLLADNN